MNTDERIEFLTRQHERGLVISNLYEMLLNCDEEDGECDICVGVRYAIRRIEKM